MHGTDNSVTRHCNPLPASDALLHPSLNLCAHVTHRVGHRELDESITNDMFAVADSDKDGEVSLDEFKAIMRAGPKNKPKAGSLPEAKSNNNDLWFTKCAPPCAPGAKRAK